MRWEAEPTINQGLNLAKSSKRRKGETKGTSKRYAEVEVVADGPDFFLGMRGSPEEELDAELALGLSLWLALDDEDVEEAVRGAAKAGIRTAESKWRWG